MIEQSITILGSDIHYWTFNPGKPQTIVMIHGFRGTHHGLQDIIDNLPDYHIIIPDLPGFGESTPMSIRHDIAGYTKFVQQFITQLRLDRPALLGHSFGSIVTASVAANSPEMIDKLILVNPISTPALAGPKMALTKLTKLYYQVGSSLPEKPGRKLLSSKTITQAASMLMAKTHDKTLRKQIHGRHIQHFSSFQTRKALLEAFDASTKHTVLEFAPQISAPTLLIAGESDDIAPPKGQYQLQRTLPNAQLAMIPSVGHLIHYEKPKEAAEAITHFLDANA